MTQLLAMQGTGMTSSKLRGVKVAMTYYTLNFLIVGFLVTKLLLEKYFNNRKSSH